MIVVQVHDIEVSLDDIARHGRAHRRVQSEGQPRITRVDGAGIGPVQLPLVPEVDGFLAVVEDVLIDLETKSMATEGDLRLEGETGELAPVVMGKTGRENFDVEFDILLPRSLRQLWWQLFDNCSQAADFCAQTTTHAANFPGKYSNTQRLAVAWHVYPSTPSA